MTATVPACDCTVASPKYVEGLNFNFVLGQSDLVRKFSNLSMRYWNFI